jgi:hypothetical protein
MRWLGLLAGIILCVLITILSENFKSSRGGLWKNVASANVAGIVIMCISIIPIACHDRAKYAVRIMCIFVFFVVAFLVLAFGNIDTGISVLFGAVYGSFTCFFELHVCTDLYREICGKMMNLLVGNVRVLRNVFPSAVFANMTSRSTLRREEFDGKE